MVNAHETLQDAIQNDRIPPDLHFAYADSTKDIADDEPGWEYICGCWSKNNSIELRQDPSAHFIFSGLTLKQWKDGDSNYRDQFKLLLPELDDQDIQAFCLCYNKHDLITNKDVLVKEFAQDTSNFKFYNHEQSNKPMVHCIVSGKRFPENVFISLLLYNEFIYSIYNSIEVLLGKDSHTTPLVMCLDRISGDAGNSRKKENPKIDLLNHITSDCSNGRICLSYLDNNKNPHNGDILADNLCGLSRLLDSTPHTPSDVLGKVSNIHTYTPAWEKNKLFSSY